jgi:hypothetical protein
MTMQSYETHAFQPTLALVAAGGWLLAVVGAAAGGLGLSWGVPVGLTGLLLAIACLVSISRVYVTRLQDRIILLEERLRAERLLAPMQLARWDALGVKQVVALRFASDEEFPALMERAVSERLAPDAIKRAVTVWRADHLRT